jgi:hypothetical protein
LTPTRKSSSMSQKIIIDRNKMTESLNSFTLDSLDGQ